MRPGLWCASVAPVWVATDAHQGTGRVRAGGGPGPQYCEPVFRRVIPATLLGAVILVTTVAWAASPAGAQTPEAPDTPAASHNVFGALAVDGEPVEGVDIEVESADGEAIGSATTDAAGEFAIPVPQPGTYRARLNPDTLPDGVRLSDPDKEVLDRVRVLEGRDKRIGFLLTTGDPQSGAQTNTAVASRTETIVNLMWSGLKLGLIVALASVGLSIVFGTTGLVNFAHGEFLTLGALITWFFNSPSVGPALVLPIAAVFGVTLTAASGAVMDRTVWRPLERKLGLVSLMIVTIGLSLLLRHGFAVLIGASPRPFVQYSAQTPWEWGPLTFPPRDLWVMAIAALAITITVVGLERTRLGTAIRAVSDNRDLAASSGINTKQVVAAVWVTGAGLAALGGVLLGATQSLEWDMGLPAPVGDVRRHHPGRPRIGLRPHRGRNRHRPDLRAQHLLVPRGVQAHLGSRRAGGHPVVPPPGHHRITRADRVT